MQINPYLSAAIAGVLGLAAGYGLWGTNLFDPAYIKNVRDDRAHYNPAYVLARDRPIPPGSTGLTPPSGPTLQHAVFHGYEDNQRACQQAAARFNEDENVWSCRADHYVRR